MAATNGADLVASSGTSRVARGSLLVGGSLAALVALSIATSDARAAAAQVWPAFVLVAGLLLVG